MIDLFAEERLPRLPGYDYSQAGAYFITICTKERVPLFWSASSVRSTFSVGSASSVGSYGHTTPPFKMETPPSRLQTPPSRLQTPQQNENLLRSDLSEGGNLLSKFGEKVVEQWLKSAEIRQEVFLGEWVVMPDHFHGIVILNPGELHTYGQKPQKVEFKSPSRTVGALVRGFKAAVTKEINSLRNSPGKPVWQSNYYEHIIRDDAAFRRLSAYIRNNPLKLIDGTRSDYFQNS